MTQKRKKSKSRSKHHNQIGKNISEFLPTSSKPGSNDKENIVKVENKSKECVEKDASKLLSSYQDAIVCRSIVELALLNILIGGNTCDNNLKVSNTKKASLAAMSASGAGNTATNAQSNTGGMSKLQDLGRSLFGFLTGGTNGQNDEENSCHSKKNTNAARHRESLDFNSDGTTSRQRPASQVSSAVGTPHLIHRKPPLQKEKQMSINKTTSAVAQEKDNPVATKRKKKKNSIDNSNSIEVENKQNEEKSSNVNATAPKTKPPPSGKKRNRSASNKRRRMKAKEKSGAACEYENEDNEKDEYQDDNDCTSPHMVDNIDSTTKKDSIINRKGSVAMITHNDNYDNNSKEPTQCHNQQNIINKKPDKECEEETVFHSARNSVIIDNKLIRQDSELSSDRNEKYYSQENLSVKCSDDATEWRGEGKEKGEGCTRSAQREDSVSLSYSCAQSAEVSCNNNLVGKKLPEQRKDLADVVQQNKLRGQGEVEPGDIHKHNINPQFNITSDTVNIKSTDNIKESISNSDVKLTDSKEESGEGLCGLSCEETITKISTSVNINPPGSHLLPPVGDKTSPPISSQSLSPENTAPPTSTANTGVSPPPAPPPPPPGYLTESIRVLSSSSASSKSSCRKEKQSNKSVDSSLKEFCKPSQGKKVKKTREELLLEQIAGVDDTFASFLRTQLNIIPVSRDRDDKQAENSTESNNTLEKRKPRRRRGDSECSEGSVRSEKDTKTTVAASGQITAAVAPQTSTVSTLTVEEESKSGSSTPKQCQLENVAEISSSKNTAPKDYQIESTYSTIPPQSDSNVVKNESENSDDKTALNEKLESNLESSEEEKVQPSSEIDTLVDYNNCNTSTSIGQQEDIYTQEAQQDINMSASTDQNVLTEVSVDTSIDNVDAANNNVSTDDNTKNTSEIICDTTTTNNYNTEQPTPNIETDKIQKQTIISVNTKCEDGYSSMGGTHSSLETTTTTSTSPTSDLQSTSSCTEDHSSEENTGHHSDACYTENAPKDGEMVSMLSKSDSGYSGNSPKAARKKDISIDEAMKLYNRRVLGADNSLLAPQVPTVVPTPKRNRIESEGSDYSDYTDSDSEYSEINGNIFYFSLHCWLFVNC